MSELKRPITCLPRRLRRPPLRLVSRAGDDLAELWLLEGMLDIVALRRACTEVLRRDKRLCVTVGGDSVAGCYGYSDYGVEVPVWDFSRQAVSHATEAVYAEARRPFDLDREPAIRFTLAKIDARRHKLLLTAHRRLTNQRALETVVPEVSGFYGQCMGSDMPHPAAFAATRREWMDRRSADAAAKARRRQTDALAATEWFDIPATTTAALHRYASEHRVTIFTCLLTVLAAFLRQHTGQDHLCLSVPGRLHDTLMLRGDDLGDPSFHEIASLLRALPPPEPPEAVTHARISTYALALDVLLSLEAPLRSFKSDGVHWGQEPLDQRTRQYDLAWSFWPSGDCLRARLRYDHELLDRAGAADLIVDFLRAAEDLIQRPVDSLSTIFRVQNGERRD